MSDFLKTMAVSSAERAAAIGELRPADEPAVPLRLGSFDIIAEFKALSPAEGNLAGDGVDLQGRAQKYARGGAIAISVLTEPTRFGGSLADLETVVAAVPDTPVMRKDFLVESAQVHESRSAGASGVLLIATMLDDERLRELLDAAFGHGMFVLLESFDRDDLVRVAALLEDASYVDEARRGRLLVGVNTRNLRTLAVDSERLEKLVPLLPAAPCVAESGLHTADDAARVAALGYRLALVGTALMRSKDPETLVRAMREAGRASCL